MDNIDAKNAARLLKEICNDDCYKCCFYQPIIVRKILLSGRLLDSRAHFCAIQGKPKDWVFDNGNEN